MTTTHDSTQPAAELQLRVRPEQTYWTPKQQAALTQLGINNATEGDLAVFMHVCQRTGLDPFSRQIYMISRRERQGDRWVDKQTIQVGIDGFRVIRDRAEKRDHITVGYEDTRWYDTDGVAHEVWLRDEPPAACGLAVIKNGQRFPAVLTYTEYVQTNIKGEPAGKWKTAPAHQLEKCAEVFALRRAFPHDLAGILLPEELPDPPSHILPHKPTATRVTAAEITSKTRRSNGTESIRDVPLPADDKPAETGQIATPAQLRALRAIFGTIGWNDPDKRPQRLQVCATLGAPPGDGPLILISSTQLTRTQAARVIDRLDIIQAREEDGFAEALLALIADPGANQ